MSISKGVLYMYGRATHCLSTASQSSINKLIVNHKPTYSNLVYFPSVVQSRISHMSTYLPSIFLYYAIKSNPSDEILQTCSMYDMGYDVASYQEAVKATKYSRRHPIIYSNTVKVDPEATFEYLNSRSDRRLSSCRSYRPLITVVDTEAELDMVKHLAPTAKVLWRIAVPETTGATTSFNKKFGTPINNGNDIRNLLQSLRHRIDGIHFHGGSGRFDPVQLINPNSGLMKGIQLGRQAVSIGRSLGHNMSILDIGGGFPACHVSVSICNVIEEAIKWTHHENVNVISECGRHICGDSMALIMRNIRGRVKNGTQCYHVNDGVYHAFNSKLMDGLKFQTLNNQHIYSIVSMDDKHPFNDSDVQSRLNKTEECTLFGVTCDGQDVIMEKGMLPKINDGDYIVVYPIGDYSLGAHSSFNGMPSMVRTWTVSGTP
jgi:ornithine decarboxylase